MGIEKTAVRAGLVAAVALTGTMGIFAAGSGAVAQDTPKGQLLFEGYCAGCHESEDSGAPSTASIRQLSHANIRYTLELGYMREYARAMSAQDRATLIDWLPLNPDNDGAWAVKSACPADRRAVVLDGAARTATTFGIDPGNNRALTAAQAGLTTADMGKLELAWAVAFPQNSTMRSQPVVVGQTIFIAATDSGHIYALDTETGCVKWTYTSNLTLRSSLSFAEGTATSPALIVAGDAGGQVHAVNALTGAEVWVTDVKLTDVNRITGTPVVYGHTIFAPLSAIEVNYAGPDEYGCCIGQGAIVALDAASGKTLWVGRTMEDAGPTIKGRTGVQQFGPSGAIIWSTPVIDGKRGLIYAGTGENTSWPATGTSDAIIAFDMKTGERRWVFQATKADIWNYACGRRGANCDWPGEFQSPDHDFGATPMLITLPDGQQEVIGGQKAGVLWALEPDTGKMIWSNKIGRGSAGGGVRWGMTYDGQTIFAPLNDPPGPDTDPDIWGVGIHAVDAKTGEIKWTYQPNARDCGDDSQPVAAAFHPRTTRIPITAPVLPPRREPAPQARPAAQRPAGARPPARCRNGMAAAPMLVDGAVVTGGNGGMLRIFNAADGKVLFEYQTNRDYPQTVNGVPGHGGSLDSAPYVAANGTLFVQSGYARFGQPPGNMLLAFRPKG